MENMESENRKGVFLWAERWPPDSNTTLQVCPPEETGFVTREEFEQWEKSKHKRDIRGVWIALVIIAASLLIALAARADSTKVFVPTTIQDTGVKK